MIQLEICYAERRPSIFVRANSATEFEQYVNGEWFAQSADTIQKEMGAWLDGYSRLTLFLEDNVFVSPAPLEVASFDTVNATIVRAEWTQQQLVAVILLALLGDEIPGRDELYAIAEPLFKDWPIECRPIP